jgi:hypothetical protein
MSLKDKSAVATGGSVRGQWQQELAGWIGATTS